MKRIGALDVLLGVVALDLLGLLVTGRFSLLSLGRNVGVWGVVSRAAALAGLLIWRFGFLAPPARRMEKGRLLLFVLLCPTLVQFQLLGARLSGDGISYYVYVRSLLKDRDFDLANEYDHYGMLGRWDLAVRTRTGLRRSIYAVGPAVVWTPFFLLGEAAARIEGAVTGTLPDLSGYGRPHVNAVALGNLLYGFGALLLIYSLLRRHFPSRRRPGFRPVDLGSFLLPLVSRRPADLRSQPLDPLRGVRSLALGPRPEHGAASVVQLLHGPDSRGRDVRAVAEWGPAPVARLRLRDTGRASRLRPRPSRRLRRAPGPRPPPRRLSPDGRVEGPLRRVAAALPAPRVRFRPPEPPVDPGDALRLPPWPALLDPRSVGRIHRVRASRAPSARPGGDARGAAPGDDLREHVRGRLVGRGVLLQQAVRQRPASAGLRRGRVPVGPSRPAEATTHAGSGRARDALPSVERRGQRRRGSRPLPAPSDGGVFDPGGGRDPGGLRRGRVSDDLASELDLRSRARGFARPVRPHRGTLPPVPSEQLRLDPPSRERRRGVVARRRLARDRDD